MKKVIFRLISPLLVVLTVLSGLVFTVSAGDGWTYADSLPSGITSDKYTIQYRNTYTKISYQSPGDGWKDEGYAYTGYRDVGEPYWSDIELPVSDTRVLVDYHYYHWCTKDRGLDVNYAQAGPYVHYDWLPKDGVYEVSRNQDYADGRYYFYELRYTNGSYAYCCSGVTCDGNYGSHGYRSYYWYKTCCYQDRTAVVYRYYSYTSDWTNEKDSYAESCTVRYKLNHTHTYSAWTVSKKATQKADGLKYRVCSSCGYKQTVKLYKVSASLAKTSATYTGKTVYPSLKVKDSKGNTLKKGTDYKVSAVTSCKGIGAHKVKVTFTGTYSGSKTLSYKIVPGKVSGISAKVKSDSVSLKWKGLSGSVKYAVYRYSKSSGKYTKLGSTSSTAYTAKGLKANTVYYFAVKAYKSVDSVSYTGAMSKVFKTETGGKPAKVTGLKASNITNKSFTLLWKAVSGKGIQYTVYWYDSSAKKYKELCKTANTNCGISNLNPNTSYSFAVKAVKTLDGVTYKGALSDKFTMKTAKNLTAPAKVTGVSGSPEGKKNNITLKWKAVSNATGYQIYRSTTGKSDSYKKLATVSSTGYSDKSVENAKKYYYKIRAYRKNSYQTVYGGYSSAKSVFSYAALYENLNYKNFTYSFVNSSRDFHYPENYRIPFSAYQRMYESSSASRLYTKENGVWGGNCFGMEVVSSMMNVYNSGITVNTFSETANSVYDLRYDSKNKLDLNLTQFIESIHTTFMSNTNLSNLDYELDEIINDVKKVQSTGKPVILSIYNSEAGHSLIAYDFVKYDNYTSYIILYDCNHSNMERKMKIKNDSNGKYISWEYQNDAYYSGTVNDSKINIYSTDYDGYINLWKNRGKLVYNASTGGVSNIADRRFLALTTPSA